MSSGVVLLTNVDVWNDGLRFLVDDCFQTYGDMLMFGMTEQMVPRAAQRLLNFNSRCRPALRKGKRRRLSISAAMIIWEEEEELPQQLSDTCTEGCLACAAVCDLCILCEHAREVAKMPARMQQVAIAHGGG